MLSIVWEPVQAQSSSYGELQAAYVYNFAKYITWPNEGTEFVIGVYKDDDIWSAFESTLKGKKVRGKSVSLKKITNPDALKECHIVYISESNSRNLNTLLASLSGKSVLIVTEEDLLKKGASISFVIEEDKLRFKVKKSALADAGLVASEGLLKLAILLVE
jgi:hypothetical protein